MNTERDVVVVALVYKYQYIGMIQRSTGLYEGCWSIPGGKIEQRETPQLAAIRELKEETGLYIPALKDFPVSLLPSTWTNHENIVHRFHVMFARVGQPYPFRHECDKGCGSGWFSRWEAANLRSINPGPTAWCFRAIEHVVMEVAAVRSTQVMKVV